jgi:hypothetical protein
MVFDSECMMTDPVSMLERCEREQMEAHLERHQYVERSDFCYLITTICRQVPARGHLLSLSKQ